MLVSKETEENKRNLQDEKSKLGCYGVRHTIALMLFFGYALMTNMRNCLNVAIVKMVLSYNFQNKTDNQTEKQNYTSANETFWKEEDLEDDVFDWDGKTVGLVLGSFYYGYTIANAIGGRLADYFGALYTFGIGVALSSLITLTVPTSSRISPYLLIAVRIIHGCVDGLGFPGTSTLIAKWYPNTERSKFTSYIYSGGSVGSIMSMVISGWICSSDYLGGWPTVFYFCGIVGLIWTIFWFLMVSEDPNTHRTISDDELHHITKDLPPVSKVRLPAPWKDVLLSKYFWVILWMNFGSKWCYYTIAIQLPTYFNNILKIDLKNNGLISAMPFLGAWVFSVVYGYFIEMFSSRKAISILSVRRISMVLGGYIPALGLLALALLKCEAIILIAVFVFSVSMFGAIHCGYFCSYTDIAPRFSGTLFGICNTFGGAAGCLTPLVMSFFADNFAPLIAWEYTFLTAAIITAATTTLYIFIITTEVQPWNEPKEEKEKNNEKSKENV